MFEFPFKTATHPNEACFNKPAGYLYLIERYKLKALPNRHLSYIGVNETFWYYLQENSISETYPASYWPGESDLAHLRFALRYDGINLGILARLFEAIPTSELIEHIAEAPEEILRRKIWFLYEFITQKELPLPDLNHPCSEELLLPEDIYYTIPGTLSKRHFIRNNLLGKNGFCPILWKTDKLNEILNLDLTSRCKKLVKAYPPELMERALTYLHKKETRSSFEIEHIEPDTSRTGKFLTLLKRASQTDFCNKKLLIEVQNQIVDPRFKDNDYRCEQNYVGQSISHRKEIIHYISPRPEDINNLMDSLLETHQLLKETPLHPLLHAAIISFGFVFMHPFNDGNGRIHRFLINNILCFRDFIPRGVSFPISAAILKDQTLYDRALEAFSKPLISVTPYELDSLGCMQVNGETADYYRYIDMTPQAEALAEFVRRTIDEELVEELDFLSNYDRVKKKLQQTVDMPDRLIDLFIRLCNQNGGKLSSKKREKHFSFLTEKEISDMENILRSR